MQLLVVGALFISAPSPPPTYKLYDTTAVAARSLHAKGLSENVCRIGLYSASPSYLVIIAIVCGSIASFLRGVAGGWGAHHANVRRTRTDTVLYASQLQHHKLDSGLSPVGHVSLEPLDMFVSERRRLSIPSSIGQCLPSATTRLTLAPGVKEEIKGSPGYQMFH